MPETETTLEMTHDQWRQKFQNTVHALVAMNRRFTSEDVTDIVGPPPSKSPNAVGSQMGGLARQKIIFRTGDTSNSRNKSSHGAEITIWSGKEIIPAKPGILYDHTPAQFEYTTTCHDCFVSHTDDNHRAKMHERLANIRRWEVRHQCNTSVYY